VWSSTGCRSSDWNYSTSTLIDFHHRRHLTSQTYQPAFESSIAEPRTHHQAAPEATTSTITAAMLPSAAALIDRTIGRRSFTSHKRPVVNGSSTAHLYGSTPSFPPQSSGSTLETTRSDAAPPTTCTCSSCAAVPAAASGINKPNLIFDRDAVAPDDTIDEMKLFSRQLSEDVREIRRLLRSYASRLEDRDAREQVLAEWRLVARVLDRVFFSVYCAAVIISMVTVFPRGAS
jgi:hypothetical protein